MQVFPEKRILTVSQLSFLVKGVLEDNFEHVWVEGEVSNLSMPASGHVYFTMKDAGAQLRCVMFRASAKVLRFKPKEGMVLIARGRITVFEPRGDYQLIAEYLEPQGMGALQLAFTQLKERLAAEGLFADDRKKPLPRLPQRIGIVTSATGAAIHDMLNVLDRRFANMEIVILPVKVQGEGAAAEIAGAVKDFNRYGNVDVLIVARGGGAMEDLWAFNEEVVARAIHASKIPIISAVGHEVDFTISDFVADLRAPTPSAAAELVIRSKEELESGVASLSHRLAMAMRHRLSRLEGEVNTLGRSLKDPSMLLGHLAQRLDVLQERLCLSVKGGMKRSEQQVAYLRNHLRLMTPALQVERARECLLSLTAREEKAIERILDRQRERGAVNYGKLQALSPLLTLARGYAIALRLPENKVVRSGGTLAPGDRLNLTFQQGGAVVMVETNHE